MSKETVIKQYSLAEEKMNVISHGIGFFLSLFGFILLIGKISSDPGKYAAMSYIIYGLSMCILYAASTLYHSSTKPKLRQRLRIFDHISIYFLIAGTYTPFCLVTLENEGGMIFFIAIWSMASIGTFFKLFFTGKYTRISTAMYLMMGWSAIFAIKPLISNLDITGLYWLLAGGVSYTIGALLYGIKNIRYNHAIFHVFVLTGSICHFIAVYSYV